MLKKAEINVLSTLQWLSTTASLLLRGFGVNEKRTQSPNLSTKVLARPLRVRLEALLFSLSLWYGRRGMKLGRAGSLLPCPLRELLLHTKRRHHSTCQNERDIKLGGSPSSSHPRCSVVLLEHLPAHDLN
jgi:hypothetical protein